MNEQSDARPLASADDAEFVQRLAEHYAPPALSPERCAALDAELRDRIAEPRGFEWMRPAFATAVVGLVLGLVLVWESRQPAAPGGEQHATLATSGAPGDAWERDLFDPESLETGDSREDVDELPDDYVAIAGFFLDG